MKPDSDELLERFLRVGQDLDVHRERHHTARTRALASIHCDPETYAQAQSEQWEEWGKLRSLEAEYEAILEQARTNMHPNEESR
jgi:hypothetical protein